MEPMTREQQPHNNRNIAPGQGDITFRKERDGMYRACKEEEGSLEQPDLSYDDILGLCLAVAFFAIGGYLWGLIL